MADNNILDPDSQLPALITPIRLIRKNNVNANQNGNSPHPMLQHRSLQKQITNDAYLASTSSRTLDILDQQSGNGTTLDTIITEYLTNQHALCKHPMATCPQFDLFLPHKCPDPRPNRHSGMSMNFATRFFKKQAGFSSTRLDRRLVHSNFSAARVIRAQDQDFFFTCCDFTVSQIF
jgi:HIV-1 Vpr-binding protein